jgi:hypothetical protein
MFNKTRSVNGTGAAQGRARRHHGSPGSERTAPYYVASGDGASVELIAHARAAGLRNLPETSAQLPTDAEGAVLREYERQHRALAEETRQQLATLAADFDRVERQRPAPRDLRVIEEGAPATIEHRLGEDHSFVPLRQHQQLRRREQRAIEREQNITEPARYPASRLLHLGVLAILVVVESALNSALFARSSELGLLGGYLIAVGVSLVNVILGVVTGFFARWRNQPVSRLRRLATLGVAVFVVLTVAFNVGVGHLRDQLAGAAPVQMADLLRHPFSITFTSAVLVLIGILASVLAFRKGYTLDSRVPGHGDADRAFRAADRAMTEYHQALRRDVMDCAQRVPDDCRSLVERAEGLVEQMVRIATSVEQATESYAAGRARLELWCHQHLHQYRAANEAVRSTPAPKYFGSYPTFPVLVDGELAAQLRPRLETARQHLEKLKAAANHIVLNQPARVTAAAARFTAFVQEAKRRADSGRGDDGLSDPGGREEKGGTAA